jgi:hypothetical protein
MTWNAPDCRSSQCFASAAERSPSAGPISSTMTAWSPEDRPIRTVIAPELPGNRRQDAAQIPEQKLQVGDRTLLFATLVGGATRTPEGVLAAVAEVLTVPADGGPVLPPIGERVVLPPHPSQRLRPDRPSGGIGAPFRSRRQSACNHGDRGRRQPGQQAVTHHPSTGPSRS